VNDRKVGRGGLVIALIVGVPAFLLLAALLGWAADVKGPAALIGTAWVLFLLYMFGR
jgi:hypothetical protein